MQNQEEEPKSPRTKYFENNSFTHEDVGEALDFVIAKKQDYSKYSHHKLMEDISHYISHLITEEQHIDVFNTLQKWKEDDEEPHKYFARNLLWRLYSRLEPPWGRQ